MSQHTSVNNLTMKQVLKMKILLLLGIIRPASKKRIFELPHITLHCPLHFYFILCSATGKAALLFNYFIVKFCSCANLSLNKYREFKMALLKPRLSAIGVIFYVHNDDINTCVRNQQDYTLGLFEWVEEGFRVRMCERKKRRRDYMAFMCLWQLYFP